MPKIIVHAPEAAFDVKAREAIVAELTDFALECEGLPLSPFMRSSVWTFFNLYPDGTVFTGDRQAAKPVVSVQIHAIQGGLIGATKTKLIEGMTAILSRHMGIAERPPVHIVIHEVPESNWGASGRNPDLAAMRASSPDAPAA